MRSVVVTMWLMGCSGGSEKDDGTAETGTSETGTAGGDATLVLSFDLDADLIPNMQEPAAGAFHGSTYAEGDASAIGPNDGAVPLIDFSSDPIDFGTAGGVSAPSATVTPVPPQIVWILGCFDSDTNDCDCADPITIPNENKFQLTSGENAITLTMSLLNPC